MHNGLKKHKRNNMSKKISQQRWAEAQEAERICHDNFLAKAGIEGVKAHYADSYCRYFSYLGIDLDERDKVIMEIGCADFPALQICAVKKGILVEPLPSPILKEIVEHYPNLELIQDKVEDIDLPECDEIWLLNVMQHVVDPDLFIEKCKKAAKVIRFFEPIDWPIEIYHPHTFDFNWYLKHFPEAKRYEGTEKNFHTAHCAYGIWER